MPRIGRPEKILIRLESETTSLADENGLAGRNETVRSGTLDPNSKRPVRFRCLALEIPETEDFRLRRDRKL